MQRQIQMEQAMLTAQREFADNLEKSLALLEEEIGEAAKTPDICTDKWCRSTENMLDEFAKILFSISEPRWLTNEDSQKIHGLRRRVHDLYAQYKAMKR